MKDKRNTLQKRIVWDVFCSMTNHPSAGMVYDEVCRLYPGISKATVYRLLAEFAEEGKISRLKLADTPDHYDFNMSDHYHVVCRECGAVADVEFDGDLAGLAEKAVGHDGFGVENFHVEFVGVCKKCQQQIEKN